ncbi:MAG: hypothetical protein ABI811_02170 [Acidobacteriota bacterium]
MVLAIIVVLIRVVQKVADPFKTSGMTASRRRRSFCEGASDRNLYSLRPL